MGQRSWPFPGTRPTWRSPDPDAQPARACGGRPGPSHGLPLHTCVPRGPGGVGTVFPQKPRPCLPVPAGRVRAREGQQSPQNRAPRVMLRPTFPEPGSGTRSPLACPRALVLGGPPSGIGVGDPGRPCLPGLHTPERLKQKNCPVNTPEAPLPEKTEQGMSGPGDSGGGQVTHRAKRAAPNWEESRSLGGQLAAVCLPFVRACGGDKMQATAGSLSAPSKGHGLWLGGATQATGRRRGDPARATPGTRAEALTDGRRAEEGFVASGSPGTRSCGQGRGSG